jgi:hypothetical protein
VAPKGTIDTAEHYEGSASLKVPYKFTTSSGNVMVFVNVKRFACPVHQVYFAVKDIEDSGLTTGAGTYWLVFTDEDGESFSFNTLPVITNDSSRKPGWHIYYRDLDKPTGNIWGGNHQTAAQDGYYHVINGNLQLNTIVADAGSASSGNKYYDCLYFWADKPLSKLTL